NKGCLIFFLLLSGLTYAQEMPAIVDFSQSQGFGGLVDENGLLLKDQVQINHVLIATQIKAPFASNKPTMWQQVPFDVIFKACFSDGEESLVIIRYRLSGTVEFFPMFEPFCQGSLLDFSETQILGIVNEESHWLQLHNIRHHKEVIVENTREIITTHFNLAFEFNLETLKLEARWEYIIPPPQQMINILLDWGENPHDLDGHLTGPDWGLPGSYNNEPDRFHIYFANKNNEIAILDTGEFSNTKPEMVNIFPPYGEERLREGIYRFTVHHFNGSGCICDSGATVRLKIGDRPDRLFMPPQGDFAGSPMDIWTVFELQVAGNGEVVVIPLQYYGSSNPSQIR
ncbi:MAG: hypothetical protein DRQ41_09675, partial [Gammaproteobacteria bacterium]